MRRWLSRAFLLVTVLLVVGAASMWLLLRASLPELDGALATLGLVAPMQLERDTAGTVTVRAANLQDAAFGVGYAHGQDRFFQMDLSRRLAAGELAALFGARAVPQDEMTRRFGFRAVARRVLSAASPADRAWLQAYVAGVNAGLGSLRSRPWEYWLLRAAPEPWQQEDSLLVLHAMWWQLQFADIPRKRLRRQLEARIGAIVADASAAEVDAGPARAVMQFLYPRGTEWDAPNPVTDTQATDPLPADALQADVQGVDTSTGVRAAESPPVPPPELLDLRALQRRPGLPPANASPVSIPGPGLPPGSNNWALDGRHSASGAALVANDMHLFLGVPAVWYRARILAGGLDLNGVTLPGMPALVAGSNGRIAWGLTNSYGDWSDVVQVSCDPAAGIYLTESGWRRFERRTESIRVARAEPRTLEVLSSPLGLLFSVSADGRSCTLVRWLALEDGATNLRMRNFQAAGNVEAALGLAPEVGIPQLNLVVGDRAGRIGWTIIGRIPRGLSGPSTPAPIGWRDAAEQPRLVDPRSGRLWTANARVVEGEAERVLGSDEASGGLSYELGARARQIRDDLFALKQPATPADMLRIQLDDRALFLKRWQRLLLGTLDEDALKNAPRRAELRRLAESWESRASISSVGYRLVREFRLRTASATWQMLLAALGTDPAVRTQPPPQFEGPLWRMVTEQPEHLLDPSYTGWREFLLAQADATVDALRADCGTMERCTWGAQNVVALRHPLSATLPWLSALIDMPIVQQGGDQDMPHVQVGAFGASERFAVSPGHEAEGYLQLPGGTSGHPLSPYYRSGFDDWAAGRATPLLPGSASHLLKFTPSAGS